MVKAKDKLQLVAKVEPSFQLKVEEDRGDYGSFSIEPLERGYGHTLGSALRRVLLLSLPGAAPTYVKISGLKHQFGAVKGIREDGVDLILNIKQLRVFYQGEKPVKLKLSARGKGEVKAGKIKTPPGVRIANKGMVLATLSDSSSKLDMEIHVESGVGYSPVEDRETSTIGLIPLDADFSPVVRVNYKVEETRVGRLTNFDRLTLQIWTDGTVAPGDALKGAAEVLMGYLRGIISPSKPKVESVATVAHDDNLAVESLSVEELGLPTRIANALVKAGYEMVGDLVKASREDLVKARNLGEKSMGVIEAALKVRGLVLEK